MNVLLNAYIAGGTSTGGPLDINGTTNNGAAFDTTVLGGVGEAVAIVTIGACAATATALRVEHSDDNSTWAAITGGGFSGTALPTSGTTNKQWLFHIRTGGTIRRYLRVVATAGAGSTLYGVVWIGLHGSKGVVGSTEVERSASQNVGNSSSLLGRLVLAL